MAPVLDDKVELAELGRNVLLVVQQVLPVVLSAGLTTHSSRPLDHRVTDDRGLAVQEESASLERPFLRSNVLHREDRGIEPRLTLFFFPPARIPQECLQELTCDTTGLVLSMKLSKLVGGDAVTHDILPCICRQTALHQDTVPSILLPLSNRHHSDQRKSLAFFQIIYAKISQKKTKENYISTKNYSTKKDSCQASFVSC